MVRHVPVSEITEYINLFKNISNFYLFLSNAQSIYDRAMNETES